MATLVLSVAGKVIGTAIGGPIGGAIGGALGSVAGGFIDQALFGESAAPLTRASGQERIEEGPRLTSLKVSGSNEGAPIPRLYGRARLAGQMIWATDFEEEQIVTKQTTGGDAPPRQKGSGKSSMTSGSSRTSSSGGETTVTSIEYRYYANLAFGLSEGEITSIGRIWADGKELNQGDYNIRFYKGTETQNPDSLIEAKEGAGNVPAYRGLAYVVFERMPLGRFGNRIPQLNFEVFRAVDDFEQKVKAVHIIPSAGEFVYDTKIVTRTEGPATIAENKHTFGAGTDWTVSVDQLEAQLPNAHNVSLVVAWFGTDLRIGHCELRPGVEVPSKTTNEDWKVCGVTRAAAHVVSEFGGGPAYGGTPSDKGVIRAIQDLKARGLAVTMYPFILMDIPAGNSLSNPYDGSSGQPPYPWRGRITCDPAPGQPGSPDKTAACATQVAAFVGTAAPSDFDVVDGEVVYSGPDEWSFRRFILHHAFLCVAAGGVDAFLIGSEMRGSTWLRSATSTYPFVSALVALAADVKSVLGPGTKVTYGADWTEFAPHNPGDGSGDVHFHLDPLWSSSSIDAVGIDAYWPLSDWRDGEAHLDKLAGHKSIYELDYLQSNIFGGEGYDYFYPSSGFTGNEPSPERIAQTRLPITDGAYGKPWVFRTKDIRAWWQNDHYNRPGGVEAASHTGWSPELKPIWITELGCPAVDKGSNQPNVFQDPKSVESFAPYFSRNIRDDYIQRRYILAICKFFDPADDDYVAGSNPVSSGAHYAGRMLDIDRIYVYTWDARPYPAFPYAAQVWADGGNWEKGHWLTGRVAGGPLAAVVAKIMEDYGFTAFTVAGLHGFLDGYVIDRIMSARAALQPLELAYFFDSYESAGIIKFAHRGELGSLAALTPDDLVKGDDDQDLFTLTRAQETELPLSAKITFIDGDQAYAQGAVEARRLVTRSGRVASAGLPIVLSPGVARGIAETWLQEAWMARESAAFALPPSRLALEPTDVVTLDVDGRDFVLRLISMSEGLAKSVEAKTVDAGVFLPARTPTRQRPLPLPSVYGTPNAVFLDLPLLRSDAAPHVGYVAATSEPWPGAIAFYRSPTTTGYRLNTIAGARAALGRTLTDFYSGPLYRYDRSNELWVELDYGELASVTEEALLNGANYAAVRNADEEWEVLQFMTAELVAPRQYKLSDFLRGQFGTGGAMGSPVAAGASFVMLDSAVVAVDMTPDEIGLLLNWKYGPAVADLSDSSYVTTSHAFQGLGLRPLSPVHLQGKRNPSNGDWTFVWTRRTRIGGDSWEGIEVPLGEESELYRLEILDGPGGDALRTVEVTSPSFLYTAAMQTADFGSTQWNVSIRVAQISPSYGPGVPKEELTYDYQH